MANINKNDNNKTHFSIIKTNDEMQIAYATAIGANIKDLQGDTFLPQAILLSQLSFAKNGFSIDREHDQQLFSKSDVFVFSSHIYDQDQIVVMGKGIYPLIPDIEPTNVLKAFGVISKAEDNVEYKILKAPAWVLGIKYCKTPIGKALWDDLKAQKINGLSIYGYSIKQATESQDSTLDLSKALTTLKEAISTLETAMINVTS